MPKPEVVVDNTVRDERLRRRAIRKLKQSDPQHTYDDVEREVERMKQEENAN